MFLILTLILLSSDFALSLVYPTAGGAIPTLNPTGPTPMRPTAGGSWCVANPSATQTALQVALDYACGYGKTDCSAIQPSGPCFDPSTIQDHASYAFNSYYQKNPIPTSCVFGGAAQLATTDPSHGNCRFASPTNTPTTPTATTPTIPMTPTMPTPTIPITPPSMNTPTNPSILGGNGYGSQPTANDYGSITAGIPNRAGRKSANLAMFITLNLFIVCISYMR